MRQYLDLVRHVLRKGERRGDRTGTGTLSVFGAQVRYDLRRGFPLVTTKRTNFRAVVEELRWFLSGSTNVNDLNSKIWDAWSDDSGALGPIYGEMWRSWPAEDHTIDQITRLIDDLKRDPTSRRHIVTAWNPAVLPIPGIRPRDQAAIGRQALAPCHALFQFYVGERGLSCQLYQRSADLMIGVPFNIASYALLTHLIAAVIGVGVHEFIHTFGDVHIYLNHTQQAEEQLARTPRQLPRIELGPVDRLEDVTTESVKLHGYNPHPAIRLNISV